MRNNIESFSILLRIVELADLTLKTTAKQQTCQFQYPLADRRACGDGYAPTSALRHLFQYPLADRRACGSR